MATRVAVVIWWIGALSLVIGSALWLIDADVGKLYVGGVCALIFWTVGYIIGGSFLRPPRS